MFLFYLCLCTGQEAKRVYDEAQKMLGEFIKTKSLAAHGIVGFYPANSKGDDILIYAPGSETGSEPIAVFHGLRQQVILILEDFVRYMIRISVT